MEFSKLSDFSDEKLVELSEHIDIERKKRERVPRVREEILELCESLKEAEDKEGKLGVRILEWVTGFNFFDPLINTNVVYVKAYYISSGKYIRMCMQMHGSWAPTPEYHENISQVLKCKSYMWESLSEYVTSYDFSTEDLLKEIRGDE